MPLDSELFSQQLEPMNEKKALGLLQHAQRNRGTLLPKVRLPSFTAFRHSEGI
jgi:hypothetical protein